MRKVGPNCVSLHSFSAAFLRKPAFEQGVPITAMSPAEVCRGQQPIAALSPFCVRKVNSSTRFELFATQFAL
jgi:hypothetical protein